MRNLEVKNKKERSILLRWDALFGKKTQASMGTERKEQRQYLCITTSKLLERWWQESRFLYISNLVLFRIKQYKMFLE